MDSAPLKNDELVDFLALTTGNIYEVTDWTDEQRSQAQVWASATYYAANDYEDIEIPQKPDFIA